MLRIRRDVSVGAVVAFLAVLTVFAVPVHAAGKGNKWISLRYNFKPGDKLEYAATTTEAGTAVVSVGGNKQEDPSNTKTKTNFTYDVLEVDPQGTATVKLTLDEINIEGQKMGRGGNIRANATGVKVYAAGQLVFDSGQMDGMEEMPISEMLGLGVMPEGVQLADLFGKGVTVTLTRLGKMTRPGTAESSLGMLERFEPENHAEKLVRPGDRWSTGLALPGIDEETSKSHGITKDYLFEGFELFSGRRCAKILLRVDVDLSRAPDLQQLMPGMVVFKIRGEGVEYFDIEAGRTLKWVGEFSEEIHVVRTAGAQGLGLDAAARPGDVEVAASGNRQIEVVLKE